MAWEENSRICLHMQLIAILSRIGVIIGYNICNPVCIFPTLIPTVIHIYQHPMRHNHTSDQLYTQDTPVPVDNPTNPVDKVLIKLLISWELSTSRQAQYV